LLNSPEPKWNPLNPEPEDYENGVPGPIVRENEVLFNPKITTMGHLRDTFRIFTEGQKGDTIAADTRCGRTEFCAGGQQCGSEVRNMGCKDEMKNR
jgi:hypothetical protein